MLRVQGSRCTVRAATQSLVELGECPDQKARGLHVDDPSPELFRRPRRLLARC